MHCLQICPRDSIQLGIRVHRQPQISHRGETAPGGPELWQVWGLELMVVQGGQQTPAPGQGEQSWVSI